MKKLVTFLCLLLTVSLLFSQAPQATSYQAVIRNSSGNVLSNQLVKVRFSIRDSSANGTIVYRETQSPTTNAQGLINLFAGQGTPVTGTFSGINWGSKSKYLQTEIDITGGSNYTDMGTTQLMSVPYSLYSNASNSATTAANGLPTGTSNGDILYWNGTSWQKLTAGTYGQSLTICDGVPTWGGCVAKITTSGVSAFSSTTASVNYNVLDGGTPITARGVVWSTSTAPTTELSTKTIGSGAGTYTNNITGLIPNTLYYVRVYATNSLGTFYGPELTFTTISTTIPSLTTSAVTSVSFTTATSGGNVTSDGGASVTARGVVWGTANSPTVALSTKTVNGTGTGTFSSSISGLVPNTFYYIRSYATNSFGTSYGPELTFTTLSSTIPSLTTTAVSSVSYTTATSGGNVTSDGGASVTARGVCWSTSINPTVSLSTKTVNGSGTGFFSSSLSGLVSNTLYYIRSYATNSLGTSYGPELTFTALSNTTPSLTTSAVTSVSFTTATSGGNVTSDGGASVTARGVCWSTSINPTVALTTKTVNGTGTGAFSSNITGLVSNTIYYVRSYATNSLGTSYGPELTFTTLSNTTPSLTTATLNSVSYTSATSGGNITSDGGLQVTSCGVVWSTSTNPTIALATKTIETVGIGSFTSNLIELAPNTTYYVRAYATNSIGTSYGSELTFTTLQYLTPTVTTSNVGISPNSASSGGLVINDGGLSVTGRGVVWSTNINPTISLSTKTVDSSGVGAYTSNITGLMANTSYNIRSYATNSLGTSYGEQLTFTTLNVGEIPRVTIGTQIWTTQNLSVARYRNGDLIPQVTDPNIWTNLTTGAWCWYNNDSATYAAKYGRLYNWYAVNDVRGLAPLGWHIPSDDEWSTLITALGGSGLASRALRSTTGWSYMGTSGTNTSGFSGLPAGYRGGDGFFNSVGNSAFWWSATQLNSTNVWCREINYNISGVSRISNPKSSGFSIRCIKD